MPDLSCDVAIIGAGTAGLAAERSARRSGASTHLIDDGFSGTTCTTVGCMPSKLLIAAADAAHAVRQAEVFGIEARGPLIDGAAVMARLRRERDGFVESVKQSFRALPEGVALTGRARFIDRTTLDIGEGRRVSARAVVIATGAAPSEPEAFDAVKSHVLTNDTLFDLETLPQSVGVVGAGPLGLELAQALARLGVEVQVFDQSETLAVLSDPEVAKDLRRILEREFPIHLGVALSASLAEGGVQLAWAGDAPGEHRFDRILVAAGRPPRIEGLELTRTGVTLDAHGSPCFDPATLQCDGSSIFIAGDAAHDQPVLHVASEEGTIAGHNAASFPKVTPGRRTTPLAIMFTDPPLAVIGAKRQPADGNQVVGAASYEDQGRAKMTARNAGLVHVYADVADGRLTGASMVGPGVEHTAHLIAWSIQEGRTATEILDLPFYHPTYEEGLKPALRQICETIHAPTPADRDQGILPGS
ncbi:dihydrolipoyl dehydrogenase [Caulobacter sp. S45]|uniref:dihydrolipoyl dehydrogenase n=1 Tax=Caulobacter sp. S45 TaxID=1641861 RepID=UPI00131B9A87|nr:dihydrolipoyl dehydrogenase [Caulobacter sp. S45]